MDPNIKSLFGYVKSISEKNKDLIKVASITTGKEYGCFCNYNIPISEGDVISGIIKIKETAKREEYAVFVRPPYVEPAVSESVICNCFTRCLRATGFGAYRAKILYDDLEKKVNNISSAEKNGGLNPGLSLLTVVDLKTQLDDQSSRNKPSVPLLESQSSSSSDIQVSSESQNQNKKTSSVASFLNEISVEYEEKKDLDMEKHLMPILTQKQASKLLSWWYRERSIRRLILIGIPEDMIKELKRTYDECYDLCMKNPYRVFEVPLDICSEICSRVGFTIVNEEQRGYPITNEEIAATGGKILSEKHIRRGQILRRVYENCIHMQWMCTPVINLVREFPDLLNHVQIMYNEGSIVVEHECLYLRYHWEVERYLAQKFSLLIANNPVDIGRHDEEAEAEVKTIETVRERVQDEASTSEMKQTNEEQSLSSKSQQSMVQEEMIIQLKNDEEILEKDQVEGFVPDQNLSGREAVKAEGKLISVERVVKNKRKFIQPHFKRKSLTDRQKQAIYGAINYEICAINGGAGTGKTTVMDEILYNFEILKQTAVTLSYTGKAVSKIKEIVAGSKPYTFHRFIAGGSREVDSFDVVLVDETSMVTEEIMYLFWKRRYHPFRLVLIGDLNQLEPIGCGLLFKELIESTCIPVITLNEPKRQRGGLKDGIVVNAMKIIENKTQMPVHLEPTENFQVISGGLNEVFDKIRFLQNQGKGPKDITIVSPYTKDLTELNNFCQTIFNDCKGRVVKDEKIFYIDDRVMMLDNNYDINVMNGEEGDVVDFDPESIWVRFSNGAQHQFFLRNLSPEEKKSGERRLSVSSLAHSFALTVHKSQGSEWDYVIVYVPKADKSKFITKNLLYTAITRAKLGCIIICDIPTLLEGTRNNPLPRKQNLAKMLIMKRSERERMLADLENLSLAVSRMT